MQPNLAARLGRPDLAAIPSYAPDTDPWTGSMSVAGNAAVSGNAGGGVAIDTGKLTASYLMVAIVGMAAFYLWTRSRQA